MTFANRTHAGKYLARSLGEYADRGDTLVLGLPRGGVPVASEVARALNLPLDVLVVRKLGVPGHEELAMGAIAGGGVRVINEDVTRPLGISDLAIERVSSQEARELERREALYRGDRPPVELHGRTVILVDDGLATGSTMRAAIQTSRAAGAAKVIVAVPVGAPETCRALARIADEVVCPFEPPDLAAISLWYEEFDQTSDREVKSLLADSYGARPETADRAPENHASA